MYLGVLRFEVNGRRPELDRWWRALIDISEVEGGNELCWGGGDCVSGKTVPLR